MAEPITPKKHRTQTNPNSLRNLLDRWKNYRKEIKRKRRRAPAQLLNLRSWWKPGQRSPNPAGRAASADATPTVRGIEKLSEAPRVWAEESRQAREEVAEQQEQEQVRPESTPEAIHAHDWAGQRYEARHPEMRPEIDPRDWNAMRCAARSSNVSGHHGAGRTAQIRTPGSRR